MLIPLQHLEDNIKIIQAYIRKYNFGTVVYQSHQGLQALHVPFILEVQEGHDIQNSYGTLKAHINKQNPELEALHNQQELLIIFSGPHAYISPAWYERSTAPTWDFIKIHAFGRARIVEHTEMLAGLDVLIKTSENKIGNPWGYDSLTANLPPIYLQKMLPKIVGIEIDIERFECQTKLSQERTAQERAQIIRGLLAGKDLLAQQLVEYLQD